MSGANTRSVLARFCDNNWEKEKYFVKTFCQKTCVGEGEERECALDDVFGIWVTVRSCCEKQIETRLCAPCEETIENRNCFEKLTD